jgi:uncharacterized membrane protein
MLRVITAFLVISLYTFLFAFLLQNTNVIAILLQALCYLIALFITIYLFLYQFLERDYETFSSLDDQKRNELSEKSREITADQRGVNL